MSAMVRAPKPPEHERLTVAMLRRALVVHERYWEAKTDKEQEDHTEEWFDFMCVYGLETICLAVAALGRIAPVTPSPVVLATAGLPSDEALENVCRELRELCSPPKADPPEPTLHLSPPRDAVKKGAVQNCQPVCETVNQSSDPRVSHTSPALLEKLSNLGAKPEPASQNSQPLPISPKPAALTGVPRAPLVGAGRGRTSRELSEVGRRGAEAARTARAVDRALGPSLKLSTSDDVLEAWCREQLNDEEDEG